MAQALSLSPIRASTRLNDYSARRLHLVGLGCEAVFYVRPNRPPRPGYPLRAVTLSECYGFTHEQCDALASEVERTLPGLRDRTHTPVTEEGWRYAVEAGESTLRDPGVAVSARYLPDQERLEVAFSPTDIHLIDLGVFEALACASAADLSGVELSPYGLGLYFPALDVDLSTLMLWRGDFNHAVEDEDDTEEAA